MIAREWIFDCDHCIWMLLLYSFECAIEVGRASHLQRLNIDPQSPARDLRLLEHDGGIRIRCVPQHRHAREPGQNLFQQFQSLAADVRRHQAHPGDVTAGPR
jgi:hypothetical protein